MDVQITGFGLMKTYHANNEYALEKDLLEGGEILAHFIANYEDSN
jgi:acetylornithine deacetylase/succinyl-diaminopimelate desuccinylase-like protein